MGRTAKKSKRKLKRTVRRTIGALCLISAITVAAIPVPENLAAYTPGTDSCPTYDNILCSDSGSSDKISVAAAKKKLTATDCVGNILSNSGKTYTVTSIGGISYLDWQFEYVADTSLTNGFISSFNTSYTSDSDTLTVGEFLFADYAYVDASEIAPFYTRVNSGAKTMSVTVHLGSATMSREVEKLGYEYTLSGYPFKLTDDPENKYLELSAAFQGTDEYTYYSTYFADDLNNYIETYRKYKKGEASAAPGSITKCKFDHPDYNNSTKQDQYLCESLLSKETGWGMTVELVKMYTYVGGVRGNKDVYVFKITDGVSPASKADFKSFGKALYTDYNNYLTCDYIRLVGFKENSLQGISNVTNLVLKDNIKYICDRAFYDSRLLSSISLPTDTKIGNQAFANGADLKNVSLGGVKEISKEAFSNTKITSITIPDSVTKIEDGAFSKCSALSTVSFEGPNNDVTIGNGAFADCEGLMAVDFGGAKVTKIGECAFAICNTGLIDKDKMQNFVFSSFIETGDNLGQYVLANRNALKDVTLSSGMTTNTDLPDKMLMGCKNLERVYFPDQCSQVGYDATMFLDVVNPNFYVQGPAKHGSTYSTPRKSTWSAKMNNISGTPSPVTYKFIDNGVETFEIYQNGLILGIDANGKLVNCTYEEGKPKPAADDFTIPASVGGKQVVAIGEGCFDTVKDNINKLTIADGCGIKQLDAGVFEGSSITELDIGDSVESIGAAAFKDSKNLTKATIGENVSSIGVSAFEGCANLVDIVFDVPNDPTALTVENIGTNALSTGSTKLTVQGIVTPTYGPFAWAMQNDNFVDSDKGIRVCYKTSDLKYSDGTTEKTSYTILLDNTTLLPTVVDIPHYEELSSALRTKIENGTPLTDTEQSMYNSVTMIEIPEGVKSIDVKGYISRTAADSKTNKSNDYNESTYLSSGKYFGQHSAYGLFNGYYGLYAKDSDTASSSIVGNDNYNDYAASSSDHKNYEEQAYGNDRITSVVLNSVESLPDKCFASCEKLQTVNLGPAMKDVGALPFYQCDDLASVACSSGEYQCENGILYKLDSTGTPTEIVEVLAGRGTAVGETTINSNNDPKLTTVETIADGAFSECNDIKYVYFNDSTKLKTIPKDCFMDCDSIKKIDLPANVEQIEDHAFSDIDSDVEVIARNKNLVLATNAFVGTQAGTKKVSDPTVTATASPSYVTYEDAPSRTYIKKEGVNVEETLDDVFTVEFYSYDGKESFGYDLVTKGDTAIFPGEDSDLVRDGYTFTGWSKSLKNVQSDMWVLAQYTEGTDPNVTPGTTPGVTPGTTPGVTPGTTPGVTPNVTPTTTPGSSSSSTKYTLTVVYGSGSGSYPEGTKVIIEAIDAPAGKVFDKWVVTGASASIYSSTSKSTTLTMAKGDSAVTATYKDVTGTNTSTTSNPSSTGTYTRTGTGTGTGTNTNTSSSNNGTRVDINKPGISDVDKAYASVSGSTDSFVVKITESADAANQVATALANKYGDMSAIKYFAMDISLYDATGNTKITDTSNLSVNVTMPIPDALRQYAGNNKVGAVVNGNQLEDLTYKFVTVDGVPCISFTATHFSPYTIYVDTNNLTAGTIDGSPKTGDPIHPKWFVVIALAATSLFLFLKKDRVKLPKAA